MAMHLRHFTVRGRGEFPLDMLRYDCCWPRRGDDVAKITPIYATITPESKDEMATRDVRLVKYAHLKRGPFVEAGRWRSFGWEVVRED